MTQQLHPGRYKHHKDGTCNVLGIGKHIASGELAVLYQPLQGGETCTFFAHPLPMFFEEVEGHKPCFTFIDLPSRPPFIVQPEQVRSAHGVVFGKYKDEEHPESLYNLFGVSEHTETQEILVVLQKLHHSECRRFIYYPLPLWQSTFNRKRFQLLERNVVPYIAEAVIHD